MKNIIFISLLVFSILLLFASCDKKSPTTREEPKPPTTGSLTVSSDPGEAEIWVDDQNTGKITTQTVYGISLGQHKVTLKKANFQNFNWNITMVSTGLSYDVDLAPGAGEFWPNPVEDANIKIVGNLHITRDYANDWKCIGEFKNFGGRWADWIKINFSFYDSSGNIIGTDYTYCNGTCGTSDCGLKPAQKGSFEQWTFVNYFKVASYEYNITWVTRGYGASAQEMQDYQNWLTIKSQKIN